MFLNIKEIIARFTSKKLIVLSIMLPTIFMKGLYTYSTDIIQSPTPEPPQIEPDVLRRIPTTIPNTLKSSGSLESAQPEGEIIFSDDFSGPYPGEWIMYTNKTYGWAWPDDFADTYADQVGVYYYYPNNLRAVMTIPAITLNEYDHATLSFNYNVDTEMFNDVFSVWAGPETDEWQKFFFDSGPSDPSVWKYMEINLDQFAGKPYSISVSFVFESNEFIGGNPDYNGVKVDNVVIEARKDWDPFPYPLIGAECEWGEYDCNACVNNVVNTFNHFKYTWGGNGIPPG